MANKCIILFASKEWFLFTENINNNKTALILHYKAFVFRFGSLIKTESKYLSVFYSDWFPELFGFSSFCGRLINANFPFFVFQVNEFRLSAYRTHQTVYLCHCVQREITISRSKRIYVVMVRRDLSCPTDRQLYNRATPLLNSTLQPPPLPTLPISI